MWLRALFALILVIVGVTVIGYGCANYIDSPWSIIVAALLCAPLGYAAVDLLSEES